MQRCSLGNIRIVQIKRLAVLEVRPVNGVLHHRMTKKIFIEAAIRQCGIKRSMKFTGKRVVFFVNVQIKRQFVYQYNIFSTTRFMLGWALNSAQGSNTPRGKPSNRAPSSHMEQAWIFAGDTTFKYSGESGGFLFLLIDTKYLE